MKQRIDFIQKILTTNRIFANKIFICEGRGKIILANKDAVDKENQVPNLSENRAKKVFLSFCSKEISPIECPLKDMETNFRLEKKIHKTDV